jgi:hypothetical protein
LGWQGAGPAWGWAGLGLARGWASSPFADRQFSWRFLVDFPLLARARLSAAAAHAVGKD